MLLHLLGSAGAQLSGRIASCAGPPPAPAGPDWKSRGGDAKLPSWASSCTSATRSARERRSLLALRGQWRASLRPASPGPLQRRTRRHGVDTLCACTPRLSSSTSRFAKMTRRLAPRLPAPPAPPQPGPQALHSRGLYRARISLHHEPGPRGNRATATRSFPPVRGVAQEDGPDPQLSRLGGPVLGLGVPAGP